MFKCQHCTGLTISVVWLSSCCAAKFFTLVAKLLIINLITFNDQYISIDLLNRSIEVSDSEESDNQLSDEEGD